MLDSPMCVHTNIKSDVKMFAMAMVIYKFAHLQTTVKINLGSHRTDTTVAFENTACWVLDRKHRSERLVLKSAVPSP